MIPEERWKTEGPMPQILEDMTTWIRFQRYWESRIESEYRAAWVVIRFC